LHWKKKITIIHLSDVSVRFEVLNSNNNHDGITKLIYTIAAATTTSIIYSIIYYGVYGREWVIYTNTNTNTTIKNEDMSTLSSINHHGIRLI